MGITSDPENSLVAYSTMETLNQVLIGSPPASIEVFFPEKAAEKVKAMSKTKLHFIKAASRL